MYSLPYYKERDPQEVRKLMEQYPFVFLSGCDSSNRPVATQVPVLIEDKEGTIVLKGHLMKNTDHHKAFLHNQEVLAIFTGKSTYVSGTWYCNPNTASTWNYMSVHVRGTIKFLDDGALVDVLRKTSLYFENQNEQSPTAYDNLPEEFKQKAVKAIVAFEIQPAEIDTVFKLSQDRDAQSYRNIINKLMEKNEDARIIAAEMEKREKDLFPDKL